ncbi:hypothetical protein [Microcoleus sp. herbarium12]
MDSIDRDTSVKGVRRGFLATIGINQACCSIAIAPEVTQSKSNI